MDMYFFLLGAIFVASLFTVRQNHEHSNQDTDPQNVELQLLRNHDSLQEKQLDVNMNEDGEPIQSSSIQKDVIILSPDDAQGKAKTRHHGNTD
jgi:hypothetical protein